MRHRCRHVNCRERAVTALWLCIAHMTEMRDLADRLDEMARWDAA